MGAALLAAFAAGAVTCVPARAEDPCIATYDRHGTVTGRYCPDGSTKPPPAGPKRAARAPDSVDPEQSVPSEARSNGKAGGGKAGKPAPKGGEIQCGKWKTTSSQGCRGIFTILR